MCPKKLLMPHSFQLIGLCLFSLSVLSFFIKWLFVHNIDIAWYFAKTTHITFLSSFFFLCLSKEKVEDEMISSIRLRAIGITAYVFFVVFLFLSVALDIHLFSLFFPIDDIPVAYLSEFFLIELPTLIFFVYFILFKLLIGKSRKQYKNEE